MLKNEFVKFYNVYNSWVFNSTVKIINLLWFHVGIVKHSADKKEVFQN